MALVTKYLGGTAPFETWLSPIDNQDCLLSKI